MQHFKVTLNIHLFIVIATKIMVKRLIKMKYVFYVLGILILTLGISFTIQSDLGTSPFDALLVGLSLNVGLTVGSWEIIIALLLICCNSF